MAPDVERIDRLLGYLDADPTNLRLIADAAQAAFDVGRLDLTEDLVARHQTLAEAPASLLNLAGLAALRQGRPAEAGERFEAALAGAPDDPELRFHLACACVGQRDWARAADLLDEAVADVSPAAAALKVQVLHARGDADGAVAWGARAAARRGERPELLAALSAAALDADDLDRARAYALRAGEAPEALATLGLLELDDLRFVDATRAFDRALDLDPGSGRALLGRGLATLALGDAAGASELLDRSADVFADHAGAWIAAGWAQVVLGNLEGARSRFATAVRVDDTAADAHAALGLLALMAGRREEAQQYVRTARRLDRDSPSANLAQSVLLELEGDAQAGERLQQTVLERPVTSTGQTIADVLVQFARRRS